MITNSIGDLKIGTKANGKLQKSVANRLINRLKKRLVSILSMVFLVVSLSVVSSFASAAIEVYEFENPRQEAQYKGLIEEFRCPKCQNQNLAGSDSQIAQDLKRKTYEMVIAGQSDAQIREYMYERYGDFISYKPPVRPSTWILWYFPPLFLIIVVSWWLWRSKKGSSNQKITVSASPSNAEIETVESDLSNEEAIKLKALLSEHSSIEPASPKDKRASAGDEKASPKGGDVE